MSDKNPPFIFYDEACFVPDMLSHWVATSSFTDVSELDTDKRILSANLYRGGRWVGFALSTNWPIETESDE